MFILYLTTLESKNRPVLSVLKVQACKTSTALTSGYRSRTWVESLEVGGTLDHDCLASAGVEAADQVAEAHLVLATKLHQDDARLVKEVLNKGIGPDRPRGTCRNLSQHTPAFNQ